MGGVYYLGGLNIGMRHRTYRAVVLGSWILIIIGAGCGSAYPQVPPSLKAKDCASVVPPGERPNARFARKGGRTIHGVKVQHQGVSLTIDDVAQGRNLSNYDKLELPDVEPKNVMDRLHHPNFARARTFLWEHWRDRKQAYLIFTVSSVDSTSTSHMFIEKDEIGHWRVYWRIVRSHAIAGSEVDDLPSTYAVRWVIPGDWNKSGTPLVEGQESDSNKHKLEFRDTCGEVVQSF